MKKSLDSLRIGEKGTIVSIGSFGAVRRHIIDMGITPDAQVVMKRAAPLGDPIEINVRGYGLSLRKSEAKKIIVEVNDI